MNNKVKGDYVVKVPIAQVSESASELARCTSEALYGEKVTLLGSETNWGLISQSHDGYKGYIKIDDLADINADNVSVPETTHWVCQRSTLLFKQPDLKSPITHRIPYGSELSLNAINDQDFSSTACGNFVWTKHCLAITQKHFLDPITLAQTVFLGAPYRWGGRSPEGADCSGLIQQLARSQALSIPRDSGDQESFIKQQVAANDYQPSDIVYWPGHTGILTNKSTLLHATAHTLSCILEPLDAVIKRAGPISSVRRLFS